MMCQKRAIWFVWVGKCTACMCSSPGLESPKLELKGVISKNSIVSGKITWGWTAPQ